MHFWVSDMWRRPIAPEAQKPKLLIADVHKAQTTPAIMNALAKCKTEVILVLPGCTSLVQPLDVSFNAELKSIIDKLQTEHMHDNLDKYVSNGFSASARRVLITKWVGEAWEKVSQKETMIQRAFKKCGLSTSIDGKKDSLINIRGLDGYKVRNSEEPGISGIPEDVFVLDSSADEEAAYELDSSDEENIIKPTGLLCLLLHLCATVSLLSLNPE